MSEFQRVIWLSVRARHFCNFQGRFPRDRKKWALRQIDIVRESMLRDELFDLRIERLDLARKRIRDSRDRLSERTSLALRRSQSNKSQKHRTERPSHYHALFIRRRNCNCRLACS